jgi:hypothetical protein
MADVDYIADEAKVTARIEDLTRRASTARAEARHAREHPGLEEVAANAEVDAVASEKMIRELREVAIRVRRGFDWWDRDGFEGDLEAYGEPWRWQSLSENLTRDVVRSNDEIDVRLTIDVQRAYGRALESGLFNRFEICEWFETDGESVTQTRGFLFAVTDFAQLGACMFLVAQWDT